MALDLELAFKSKTLSIYEYLGYDSNAFIIPVYQRDYAWDQQQVKELIEDIVGGVSTVYERNQKDYCSYIGTIITADGIDSFSRIASSEHPGRVWSLVDGQQRISSITLLALALLYQLDESILKARKIFEESGDQDVATLVDWTSNEIKRLEKVLRWRFEYSIDYAPKVIRAPSEGWTRDGNNYRSPIPFLVMRYFKLRGEGRLRQFGQNRNPPNWPRNQKNYESDRFNNILSNMQSFVAGSELESWFERLPALENIINSKEINRHLFKWEVGLTVGLAEAENLYFSNIKRLLVFSTYFLDRVAFTVVTGMTEDVALEVFESLNTTGTPLGPYETFKPRVIRLIESRLYSTSIEKSYLDKIDEQLRLPNSQKQKEKLVVDTIINFSLGFDGQVVSKRLADQVDRLRSTFGPVSGDENMRREYLHLLWNSTEISYIFWSGKFNGSSAFENIVGGNDDALLCCQFLSDIKHTIVFPLITRFYSDFLERSSFDTENHCTADEIRAVIRAVTAFSVLWRAAWGGTAGIDTIYRKLMLKSFSKSISENSKISAEDVKTALRRSLFETKAGQRGAIGDQRRWKDLARTNPIYSQLELCKFILLAAQHDCVPDNESPGLIKKGATNSHPCWSKANFENSEYWIEHIAPVAPIANQWDNDIYEDERFKDRLGNLVVMPRLDNILVGNQPWENKKRIYQLLTESDLLTRKNSMDSSGLLLTERQKELLMQSEYQPALKSIILRTQWDKDFINKRTDRLLDITWERLFSWLT